MAKYIHLLWHNELKFNLPLIHIFNLEENGFEVSNHLFVVPYKKMYESLSEWNNVIFDDTLGEGKFAGLVNKYAQQCDWLFLHSLCSPLESLKIKKKYYGKIILRTWGSDLGYIYYNKSIIKNIIKCIINQKHKRMLIKFKAIGIANEVDAINVKKRIGNVPMFRAPYSRKDNYKDIYNIIKLEKKQHDFLNVLIGHSGYKTDNHIEVLHTLKKFKDNNIQLYIVTSYGDKDYIEKIKTIGMDIFGPKLTFVDQFMPYKDYVEFLNNMDVAIFDGKTSYALGNLYILLLLEKKIILNDKGIIRKAYDLERYPYVCSSKLKTMTFDELAQPIVYSEEIREKNKPRTYEKQLNAWRTILEYLEKPI